MLKSIIVDDEQSVREALQKMLELFCPSVEIAGTANNIFEAKELIDKVSPNLVFLDVEMPNGTGFDLLEALPEVNFSVIFTTAHADYAIKAIRYAAMDYLLKPVNVQELKKAVEKCEQHIQEKSQLKEQLAVLRSNLSDEEFKFNKIALPTTEGLEFFDTDNIIRCEADRAYCKFYLKDKKMLHISKPMSEYEDMLSQSNFLKVHKSSIVNLGHVTKYVKGKGGFLVMTDGSTVDVAATRKDYVLKMLNIKP